MNALITTNTQTVTMSSREIAELTGKHHHHVIRDIRNMLSQLYGKEDVEKGIPEQDMDEGFFEFLGYGIHNPKLDNERKQGLTVHRDTRGFISEVNLDYSHTMTLVAGYSVKLRKAIIDRWQELEAKAQQPAIPQTLPEALRLAADLAEQLTLAAPKAAALDRISKTEGSMCITDAAKTLGIQPKALFKWLSEHLWIYRRAGNSHWIAYQNRIQTGVMEQKVTVVTKSDGTEKTIEQALVTAKGIARLSELMGATA